MRTLRKITSEIRQMFTALFIILAAKCSYGDPDTRAHELILYVEAWRRNEEQIIKEEK